MGYVSKSKTKEKQQLFSFMERHHKGGSVSYSKIKEYADQKGYKIRKQDKEWIAVENKRGTPLSGMHVNKKKRVDNWRIN